MQDDQQDDQGQHWDKKTGGEASAQMRHAVDKEGPVLLRQTKGPIITWLSGRLCLVRSALFFLRQTPKQKSEETAASSSSSSSSSSSWLSMAEDAIILDSSFEFAEVSLLSLTGKKHAFSIDSEQRDLHYLFCAPSDEERTAWLNVLIEAAALGSGRDGALIISRWDPRDTDRQKEEEYQEAEQVLPLDNLVEDAPQVKDISISVCSYNVNFGMCQLESVTSFSLLSLLINACLIAGLNHASIQCDRGGRTQHFRSNAGYPSGRDTVAGDNRTMGNLSYGWVTAQHLSACPIQVGKRYADVDVTFSG